MHALKFDLHNNNQINKVKIQIRIPTTNDLYVYLKNILLTIIIIITTITIKAEKDIEEKMEKETDKSPNNDEWNLNGDQGSYDIIIIITINPTDYHYNNYINFHNNGKMKEEDSRFTMKKKILK